MTISKRNLSHLAPALALAFLFSIAGSVPAQAEDFPTGFFVGLDAGFGGSSVYYVDGKRSITEDAEAGVLGGLRIGYAPSSKLAVSLESHGFGRDNDGEDLGIGASVIAVTWRPWGSGFFVRTGAGLGGGKFKQLDNDEVIEIKERFAGTFAVGYDWRLGQHTSLGLAASGFGLDAGGVTGYEDDGVGAGGLTAQFTWHP